MNLTISPDKKILTIDGDEYHFAEIMMSKDAPVWKVKLIGGGVLMVWFQQDKEG